MVEYNPTAELSTFSITTFDFWQLVTCTEALIDILTLGDLLLGEAHRRQHNQVDRRATRGFVLPAIVVSRR
jgi:hypothetical protein